MSAITVYHVRGARSVRPIWLCHELGLDVHVETIDFSPEYRATPEWRAISPAGKVPAMTDGDLTLFESGAMVGYLLDRYGNGRLRPPPGTNERALYEQWCWFAEATLIRPLGLARLVRAGATGDELVADATQKTLDSLSAVDQQLEGRTHLLGSEFSAADVMMGYSLFLLRRFAQVLDTRHPNAHAYLDRLLERDAFQRALEA